METECESPARDCASTESVDDVVGEPYCFESDQVALKNNPDYKCLLQTICMLEAQRSKAISDLEQLYLAQEKVLQDPISFVDHLQRTGNLGIPLPGRQKLVELPAINWKKYTSSVDFKSFGTHRQSARLKQHGGDNGEDEQLQRLKRRLEVGTDPGESTVGEGFVRGRFKDESKSATFNKLWTPEEQRRLDELLIQFPPEEVEARRWRKIAAAFGDRTPQQIASRVQKYFQKLEKNRLPVPGRVPHRLPQRPPRIKKHRQIRLERDSTFLQQYQPPVWMKEDGEDHSFMGCGGNLPSSSTSSSTSLSLLHGDSAVADSLGAASREDDRADCTMDQSDDEDVSEELRVTAEYRELKQLRKLREERLQTLDSSLPVHQGFKCDRCRCGPIVGVRWHCVDCPSITSLDFCDTCYLNLGSFETASHNSSHRVRPVKRTWSKLVQDQDYLSFTTTDDKDSAADSYNYLDPNYMPAV